MGKAANSAPSAAEYGVFTSAFLRHPGLVFPGLASLRSGRHSAHGPGPLASVEPSYHDLLSGAGLSEHGRDLHIRALAGVLSLT